MAIVYQGRIAPRYVGHVCEEASAIKQKASTLRCESKVRKRVVSCDTVIPKKNQNMDGDDQVPERPAFI